MKAAAITLYLAMLLGGAQGPEASAPAATQPRPDETAAASPRDYILGPGDQVTIRVVDTEELNEKQVQVDTTGELSLPLIGRVKATGVSVQVLERELRERLKEYLLKPDVSVSVTTFRSQPVSVFGAVRNPGVYQVEGRKTVVEALSLAGGLDAAAGSVVKITRRLESGRIPLESARDDPGGRFSIAELKLRAILEASNPEENILVQPHDVITIPRAEMIYVVGQVQRAGGFPLAEEETMSVLQALSLAGGLDRTASPGKARILRVTEGKVERREIAVNLNAMFEGKSSDVQMQPQDILFIPSSAPKRAAARAAEAAIQLATGIVIWRR